MPRSDTLRSTCGTSQDHRSDSRFYGSAKHGHEPIVSGGVGLTPYALLDGGTSASKSSTYRSTGRAVPAFSVRPSSATRTGPFPASPYCSPQFPHTDGCCKTRPTFGEASRSRSLGRNHPTTTASQKAAASPLKSQIPRPSESHYKPTCMSLQDQTGYPRPVGITRYAAHP